MKANNIPVVDRLHARISKLHSKLYELRLRRIGKGNPYMKCGSCGLSEPDFSIHGHRKGCQYVGYKKQIAYYEQLLGEKLEEHLRENRTSGRGGLTP